MQALRGKPREELRGDGINAVTPDRDNWPGHQPIAPDAPIPGRQWYGGCDPDLPRVRPDGTCESCGERACPECGAGFYPDGRCQCKVTPA